MADLADVEQTLVDRLTTILYPSGPNQASIIGSQCRIYRGWPISAGLNSDLSAGIVNVTVSPDATPGRTTTRYLRSWNAVPGLPSTTLTATGNVLQVGGTPARGDVVGALVNGRPYAYRVLATDTTDLVASGLATAMAATLAISLSGSNITIHGSGAIIPRVVCDASAVLESRRQEKEVQIICWCPDPASRDAIAAAVDQQLAQTAFLTTSDGSDVRLVYRNTIVCDQAQNASLFRRDLVYSAEYPTISVIKLPSMLFGDAIIAGNTNYS